MGKNFASFIEANRTGRSFSRVLEVERYDGLGSNHGVARLISAETTPTGILYNVQIEPDKTPALTPRRMNYQQLVDSEWEHPVNGAVI